MTLIIELWNDLLLMSMLTIVADLIEPVELSDHDQRRDIILDLEIMNLMALSHYPLSHFFNKVVI